MTWARIFNGLVACSVLETVGKPMLFNFSKRLEKQNGAGWWGMTSSLCVLSLAWAQQPSGCATAEPFLLLHRHIENWKNLQTLNAVDMELYTGLQKL